MSPEGLVLSFFHSLELLFDELFLLFGLNAGQHVARFEFKDLLKT